MVTRRPAEIGTHDNRPGMNSGDASFEIRLIQPNLNSLGARLLEESD
jgi:hypothetical protein